MSIHALVDGIAMGVGFGASPELGYLIAIAILIHKAPIGFSLSGIMLARGYSQREALRFLTIFSLITPIGALFSGYIVAVKTSILHAALAFSGGTFLHIIVSELLPGVHAASDRRVLFYVIAGVLVGLLPKILGI
jgi:zinc transporter ZupT